MGTEETMIRVVSDHWYTSGSSQKHSPLENEENNRLCFEQVFVSHKSSIISCGRQEEPADYSWSASFSNAQYDASWEKILFALGLISTVA